MVNVINTSAKISKEVANWGYCDQTILKLNDNVDGLVTYLSSNLT